MLAVNAAGLPLGMFLAQLDAPQPRGDEKRSKKEEKSFR